LGPKLTIKEIARCTAGYSGSDLKEMCRNASFVPIQELIRKHQGNIQDLDLSDLSKRPLDFSDFFPVDNQSGSIYGSDGTLTGKLDLD
jgi:SpoVK/Ycf46/Vps4 family AAA+-type ATPase